MSHLITNTLAVGIVLGVIVFIHELGHFVAAKAFGVRVEVFSLGFGRRLFGFRRGVTDYRVSALPLGGYVKMAGENPVDERAGLPDEFLSKPRWQRFVIAIAGPFMNVVLAIGLLIPVYMGGDFERNSFYDQPAVVAAVDPGTPAASAGLQPRDRIIRIDGVNNPTWEQVALRSAMSAGHAINVAVMRHGQVVETQVTPAAPDSAGADSVGVLGLAPVEETVVNTVEPGSPAAAAGLENGDRIVALDGHEVVNSADTIAQLQSAEPAPGQGAGRPVAFRLARQGREFDEAITPRLGEVEGKKKWLIGITVGNGTTLVHLPFREALSHSLDTNKTYSLVILDLVGKLVSRHASISTLQGPVGIASMTGAAARQSSLLPLFLVTSLISLNLGILNLLPIPVLDGGMILFLLIETLLRHEISLRVKERVYQAGFAFLLLLMTVVVYNDIVRAIGLHH